MSLYEKINEKKPTGTMLPELEVVAKRRRETVLPEVVVTAPKNEKQETTATPAQGGMMSDRVVPKPETESEGRRYAVPDADALRAAQAAQKQGEQPKNVGWWETPAYVQEVDRLAGKAEERMKREERRARMQRNAAILGDLAKLGAQVGANAGGAWMIDKFTPQTQIANERLAKLRDQYAAQVEAYARERLKARQAEAKDKNERMKFELSMKNAELERQRKEDERAERNAYYRDKLAEDVRHHQALEEVQRQNAKTREINAKGAMQFRAYDRNGGEHYFKSKDEAEIYARQEGTWVDNPVEVVTTKNGVDDFGQPYTEETVRKTAKGGYSQKPREKKGSADFSQYKRGNTDFSKYKRQ